MAVDKLDFLVFEKDTDLYNKIRNALIDYSVQNNIEIDIYRLNEEKHLRDLESLAKTVHIALINSDYDRLSLDAGQIVFNEDETVLIVFYGSNAVNLKPFFTSRPITYMELEKDSFESVIKSLHNRMCERNNFFVWENKNIRLFIPYSRIIYMQSYKGYVDIVTSGANKYHILGKLDIVEEKLQSDIFVRVHKSALVNIRMIRSMDRTNKCFTMSNSDKVYISKAYYKSASECFISNTKQIKS